MRQLFDEVQSYMEYLSVKYPAVVIGNYKENISQNYLWTKGTLNSFLRLIDKAYLSLESLRETQPEKYELYKNHVLLESLFPRYALLKFYRATYSSEVFYQQALQFKIDCSNLSVSRESEERAIEGLWTEWGI